MGVQEKKQQRIYDLPNAQTKPKFLCLTYTKQRHFFYRKRILKKKGRGGEGRTEQKNEKKAF